MPDVSNGSTWKRVTAPAYDEPAKSQSHACRSCMIEDGNDVRLTRSGGVPMSQDQATRWHREGWLCVGGKEAGTFYCLSHWAAPLPDGPKKEKADRKGKKTVNAG